MDRPTPTIEDYLGAIYTLSRDGEDVIGRKLADWMQVSAPTVTATVQRMVRDGWVSMRNDKTIHLTEGGLEMARGVVRRHMLTELLLARVLGVPWSRVHAEADRMEHGLSSDTAARMSALMDAPDLCPHGNPLPGREDETASFMPLLDCRPGESYTLARVHEKVERDAELLEFLERHGVLPGHRIGVLELLPFNETVTLQTEIGSVVLGLAVCEHLWVCPADDEPESDRQAES